MHTPDIEIITADLSQIDVIQPLWEALLEYNSALHRGCLGYELHSSWDHKKDELRKRWKEGPVKFDIVKADDEVVGYCLSAVNEALQGEIVSVYLLEECRRKGIGTRLLSDHLKWLRENNAEHIFLYVHPCNSNAIQFYWSFGFFSNSPLMETCVATE